MKQRYRRALQWVASAKSGFTLIEILIVIGLLAVLATVVLVALNPARQFAQGRDSQRTSNVNAILNAIGQNIADNKGTFVCAATIDANVRIIREGAGGTDADLRPCIVPTYMSEIPYDPKTGNNDCDATCSGATTYDTQYTVKKDATSGRITVSAQAEIDQNKDGVVDSKDVVVVTR